VGGKFFDSGWRESAVKNKHARQGGIDDPDRNKNKRKRKKKYRLEQLEFVMWRVFRDKEDGCWELFPCRSVTQGCLWVKIGAYEKVRDAQKAAVNLKNQYFGKYMVAWRIVDKDGQIIEGGLKDNSKT